MDARRKAKGVRRWIASLGDQASGATRRCRTTVARAGNKAGGRGRKRLAPGPFSPVRPGRMKCAAFTLLEVLVAITLLGMIMVMAYQGLRTGAHSTAQGEAAIERVNRLRLSQEFLRGQLSRALPMSIEQDEMLGAVVFEGGPEVMRFVAPMPGYLSYGGPYVQTLALTRAEDGGSRLVFDHRILQYGEAAGRAPDPSADRDPVELLSGIDRAEFSYLEPGESLDEEPTWVDEWRQVDRLPMLVRIRLEMREDSRIQWPELVVAPRVEATGGRGPGLEFGPNTVDFGPNRREDER